MFYSETLLSKTGPLARVWLSANLERKLNKSHILQSNIETSVNAIVDQGQAPMALRLSGQLLLGVVRIYSRKARYLMDDCNEAILKIKMAFRPGNADVDLLGPITSVIPNPGLSAPDELAGELQFPMLDESLFNVEPMDIDLGLKDNDPLVWTSQILSDPLSIEQGRGIPEEQPTLYEDDLDLDLDITDGPSVEVGRAAPSERPVSEDSLEDEPRLYDDDLHLDLDDDLPLQTRHSTEVPDANTFGGGDDNAMDIDQQDNLGNNMDDTPAPIIQGDDPRLQRASQSPLSSVRSSEVRDFDETTLTEEPTIHQARQPAAKKRKVLPTDTETQLHNSRIKEQQNDRSAILRPVSFLPKDPLLLTLMTMQANGGFVSSIMGDGRARGLAPQLRGLLSIETVRKAGALKRKRDSGVADLDQDLENNESEIPQIQIPDEDDAMFPGEGDVDVSRGEKSTIIDLPADDGMPPPMDDEIPRQDDSEEAEPSPDGDTFDETTVPLISPEDQGPISVGTQHAVHVLRDYFGGSAEASSQKKNPFFQDLYPESTTSKAEATQMFFETLVLATKDAIKVEQTPTLLGAPIRIRPKRSLWGEWAEREAGGEIATQSTQPVQRIPSS